MTPKEDSPWILTSTYHRLLISFFILNQLQLSTAENRIFYWEGANLVQPDNFADENLEYRDIPVIEGELLKVTCKVRAISDSPYQITVYYDDFNANSTGMIEEEIAGDKYVKEDINVNIDNSAAIDGKEILCEINEPTEDTIGLLFKAYVMDKVDVSSQVCSDCDGIVTLTLRKPTIQKKEEAKLEEKLEEKLKKEYGATNVNIDSKGVVTADVNFLKLAAKHGTMGNLFRVSGREVADISARCPCDYQGGSSDLPLALGLAALVAVIVGVTGLAVKNKEKIIDRLSSGRD